MSDISSSEDFYKILNKKLDDNLLKLNEMQDNILKMRSQYAMIQLELNNLYSPKYLQLLQQMPEMEEGVDLYKQYIEMIQGLNITDVQSVNSEQISVQKHRTLNSL
ncbi:hypothetical protein J6590_046768 [Homalodisca vitripennis]|nr:hypothetical protein J6590_046768 [Homalodisca vitripennis]